MTTGDSGLLVPTQYLSYVFLLGNQSRCSLSLSFLLLLFIPPVVIRIVNVTVREVLDQLLVPLS